MKVTSDEEHAVAIERMIQLERQLDSVTNTELNALAEAADAYETAAGYTPGPPSTLRGILEVKLLKRKMRERSKK